MEITFDSGIILNVADILFCPEIIPANTQKLLFDGGALRSTYSFWKSADFALKVLEPPFISLTKSKISDEWLLDSWCLRIDPRHLNGGLKTPKNYTRQAVN